MLESVLNLLQIINNFAGQSADRAPFVNAAEPFRIYNSEPNYSPSEDGEHYFDFTYGSDAAFFVMDTRRHRSKPEEVEPFSRTMLGDRQLATFYDWLSKVSRMSFVSFLD